MTEQAPPNQASAVNDEDRPLDPAVERVRRKMMRLMAIAIGIMMVGLMAVVFGIVYKISSRGETTEGGADYFETVLAVPQGGRVVSQSLSGARLSLLVEHDGGRQTLYIFDTSTRKLLGKVEIDAQ